MFPLMPDLEFWGIDHNSIPHMGKVILTNISVYGRIVNLHVYGLIDCSARQCPFLPTMLKLSIGRR